MKRIISFHGLWPLALAVLATAGCTSSTETSAPQTSDPVIQYRGNVSTVYGASGAARTSLEDSLAPDFYWRDSTGALDSLSGLKGKVVVLNFWATWCGFCGEELPSLEAIAQTMSDSVTVIGISVNQAGNPFTAVQTYAEGHGLTYELLLDSMYQIYSQYLLSTDQGIPQSFILDRQGRVRFYLGGAQSKQSFLDFIHRAE